MTLVLTMLLFSDKIKETFKAAVRRGMLFNKGLCMGLNLLEGLILVEMNRQQTVGGGDS
jgi:hypothetical protein